MTYSEYKRQQELEVALEDYNKEVKSVQECMTRNNCRHCSEYEKCTQALNIQRAKLEIRRRRICL